MQKIFDVLLDTVQSVPNPAFTINTNDLKTIQLNILINQDKEMLDLTNATVKLAIKKPDNTTVFQDVPVVDAPSGSCEVILDTQAYVVSGTYNAEVMIYFGTDTVAVTGQFSYSAKKGILDDGTIQSTNEFQALNQIVIDAQTAETNAAASASAASTSEANAAQTAQEALQARTNASGTTFTNLKERLDDTDSSLAEKAKQTDLNLTNQNVAANTTAIIAKADKGYVDNQIANVMSGSPKGVYATLSALQAAFPTGNSNIYLVSGDGKWYYWNGSAWIVGGTYQATMIAPTSVTFDKTDFLQLSGNMINQDVLTIGYIYSFGSLSANANYDVTDFIPVKNGVSYTINKGLRFVAFFDANKVYSSMITVPDTPTVAVTFTAPSDGYIRATLYHSYFGTVMLSQGTTAQAYKPFAYNIKYLDKKFPVGTSDIVDKAIVPDKTSFIALGKNLFNYATRSVGYLVQSYDGTLTALASYDTSDYIPVKAGTTYTVNMCRKIAVYDSNKVYVTGYDVSPDGTKIITVTSDGFIKVSFGTSYVATGQVEIGSAVSSYEPYSLQIPLLLSDGSSIKDKTINALKLADGVINTPLTIVKTGNSLSVSSMLDNNSLKINTNVSGGNNLFNFVDSYYGTDKIHDTSDDITPLRTFYTVGANHGYPTIKVTMVGHGKTTADVGSIWTDGTNQYTLLQISGNDLIFNYPYTFTNGIVGYLNVPPIADLTHVSGASNTSNISISTMLTGQQLYPSVNNHALKYFLDGREITADGTYLGKELQVQESYNIMCYKEIVDYIQSHIGGTISNDNILGAARLSINYVFGDKGTCTVHHNFRALKKLSIGDCGFIQSYKLNLANYKLFKYVPNAIPKSGYDFKTPIDVTNWSTQLFLEKTDYANPNIPINRLVTWLQDSTTNQKKVGFTMGYVIDKSNSKHTDRITNSSRGIELASTGKNYPVAMNGQTFNPGDYRNFICYRNYLSASAKSNATNFTIVKDKKDAYLYIDYHTSVTFENIKLDEYVGKSITVLEKSIDFTIHNDLVDADGIIFSVANGYGYAILKLS